MFSVVLSYPCYIEYIAYSYIETVETLTYCAKIERQNKPGEMFMLMLTYSVSFTLLRPGLGIF